MENITSLTLIRTNYKALITFAALLGVVIVAPYFVNQLITGSIVNATLFIAAATLGWDGAILIGVIPSLISLQVGLLPMAISPMVPFIIISNSILVSIFLKLKTTNYWLATVTASLIKFGFLYGTSRLLILVILKNPIAAKVAIMMSWPQLVTALIGGVIAYFILTAARVKQAKSMV